MRLVKRPASPTISRGSQAFNPAGAEIPKPLSTAMKISMLNLTPPEQCFAHHYVDRRADPCRADAAPVGHDSRSKGRYSRRGYGQVAHGVGYLLAGLLRVLRPVGGPHGH